MTYVSDQGVTGDRRDERWQFYSLHEPSEEKKKGKEYLYFWADYFIGMTREQTKLPLEKCYAQKKGFYDPFRPLRLNRKYGIKNPRDVAHVPVVEPFYRRLRGTHKSTPIRFQTTTNNTSSFFLKKKEKQNELIQSFAQLENQLLEMRKQGTGTTATEQLIEQAHSNIKFSMENFRSSLEIQGHHALNYLVERCGIKDIMDDLFDDYFVSRHAFWQCKVEKKGVMPKTRALDPRKLFFSKKSDTKWLRECDMYVYKERRLVTDVLAEYGEYFDSEQIKIIQDEKSLYWLYNKTYYTPENWENVRKTDPDFEINGIKGEYIDVYYVEWKAMNKKDSADESPESFDKKELGDSIVTGPDKIYNDGYRQDLYCCTRVGSCIYLKSGKIEHVVRHQDDPDKCFLTADGMIYDDRFGDVESLYQRCQSLADDYDVYSNKLRQHVSKSGPKVLSVYRGNIPAEYGSTPQKRVVKYYELLYEGINEISDQPGSNINALQYSTNAIDLSMSKDVGILIQILEFIEELIGRILGVPRQALGDIGQTDGKGTTQMALMQYLMMSQDIFMDMHRICQVVLTMLINAFKIAFPNGFAASYSDKGQQIHFETTQDFSLASFNVFLSNTGEEQALLELFQKIAGDMAAQGNLAKEDLIAILGAKSLAEIQRELYKRLEAEKNDMTRQLQQQITEMEQNVKDLQRQIDVNQQAENENNAMKLQLEEQKMNLDAQIKSQAQQNEKEFQDKKIALDQKRVNLEGMQLIAGDGSNAEVKNS